MGEAFLHLRVSRDVEVRCGQNDRGSVTSSDNEQLTLRVKFWERVSGAGFGVFCAKEPVKEVLPYLCIWLGLLFQLLLFGSTLSEAVVDKVVPVLHDARSCSCQ